MPPKVKGFHLGWKIDKIAEKFGYRFLCYSAYLKPPLELEHMKSDKPLLHLPDVAGYLRCIYCGRFKRFHAIRNLPKNML